ncbi:MAG: hypothetical protein M1835_002939 [Candelina submexicana]|nr:MAG: hypothetical protein M1835_002939 [Candelina submexicana]
MASSGMIDFFHPPLVCISSASGSSESIAAGKQSPVYRLESSNRISQLPPEIQDEIFSLLGPATLEAARAVCLAWRTRISSNRWILRKALRGSIPESRSWDNALEELSLLKKQLRVAEGTHDDIGKARYTRHTSHFIFPEQPQVGEGDQPARISSLFACPATVACLPFGRLIAFVIRSVSTVRAATDFNYTLMLFHIFRSGQPALVAAVPCPEKKGAPSEIKILEITGERLLSCKIEVTFPVHDTLSMTRSRDTDVSLEKERAPRALGYVGSLLLIQRPAFGKEQSPFELPGSLSFGAGLIEVGCERSSPPTESLVDNKVDILLYTQPRIGDEGGRCPELYSPVAEPWPVENPRWTVLEAFASATDFLNIRMQHNAYFLAKHEPTDCLFLVHISGPSSTNSHQDYLTQHGSPGQSLGSVTPLVLLSPPYRNCTLRNLTIASKIHVAHNPELLNRRVAIIWQNPASTRPVLFFYDIPLSVVDCTYSEEHRCKAEKVIWPKTSEQYMPSESVGLPLPDPGPSPRQFGVPKIYGKRISSLRPGLGGLHLSMGDRASAIFKESHDQLGERAFAGGIKLPEDGHQQCLVWGPSRVSESATIGLQLLSFNFAREFFYHDYMCWHFKWGAGRQHFARGLLGNCPCPLHDKVFRVTLPNELELERTGTSGSPPSSGFSSWLPRGRSSSDNAEGLNVSITLVESPAQIQARERYERESSALYKQVEKENKENAKALRDRGYRFRISLDDPSVAQYSWWSLWQNATT